MRLLDLALSALRALRELDYRGYLTATWVIATDLSELYGNRNRADGLDLTRRSLQVLRMAVEGPGDEIQAVARERFFEWLNLMGVEYEPEDPDDISLVDVDVEPGVLNLWFTICDVMAELAGEAPPYSGVSRLTLAVEMFAEEASDTDFVLLNGQEVAEDSFSRTYLSGFRTVADLIRQSSLAPEALRGKAFGR